MKIFTVSYYSSCGTYFNAYLKSVTVMAENEQDARKKVAKWCKQNYSFLVEDSAKWGVQELKADKYGVIDYDCSADY